MKYRGLHTPPTMWRGPTPPPNPRPGDVWYRQGTDMGVRTPRAVLTYTVDGWRW